MKAGLKDSVATMEIIVTDEMTAKLNGVELHRVYSTFWLAMHVESVARLALEPYLDAEEDAVGSELCIKHLQMAAIGASIRLQAEVVQIKGRKVVCNVTVEAIPSRALLAESSQTQVVLLKSDLYRLVSEAVR